MNPHPSREETLFFAAAEMATPEMRAAFLDRECAGDATLRGRVEVLLKAADDANNVLDGAPIADNAPAGPKGTIVLPVTEKAGDTIGRYKLLQQIGEGGCGVVYMAEQSVPVKRRVALKVIKLGMDTKQVVARFEAERQALALMDHPNIAKVLDAGATDTGRPFFVMELVRGTKITEFADQQKLSTQERLDLFIQVCSAIQHAHQKGIIHRDIKPSNVLVTMLDGKAIPKVIDFGIAKATSGQELTDKTLFTAFEQFIGTPAYMSPEQAEMSAADIDTRSDIYSLGVLLYELLTGRTPFDATELLRSGVDGIRKTLRDQEPARPSARLNTLAAVDLTTVAKARHVEPLSLLHSVRGDLDWVVMKCLEKDRGRRYETANGIAADLKRHLGNEPVTARPPSTTYRLQKLMRRNKVAFAAGTAIAASLVIGITVSVWQAVLATRAKKEAVTAFDELRATAPAFAEQARGLAAREQYADAITKLDYAIKLRPDAAEFLVQKADLLQCQFKLADAAVIYREALRVQPGHARAEASAKLCDELLAAPTGSDGKLTLGSLGKLHLAMLNQQRPAAELLPVARLLGQENKHIVEYWLERLKDLPISADKPLKDRLTVREDTLLELDLKGTKITSLEPLLEMAPKLGKLVLWDCTGLEDFTLLREFRSLKYLDLDGTQIRDLAPLPELQRLEELYISYTGITDLSPLRGMKLNTLEMSGVRADDLKPLAGMPLKVFRATYVPTKDFSPLKGAPLEECYIAQSPLRDLSFLSGAPLKSLYLFGCDGIRGLSLLSELKSLERLVLPTGYRGFPPEELEAIAALERHPMLKWIQADPGNGDDRFKLLARATQSKEIFWRDWEPEHAFVKGLRKMGVTSFRITKDEDNSYYVWIDKQPIPDLSVFKIIPISALWIGACSVTDLSPLAELRGVRILGIFGNPVSDLRPLRGMPTIEWLSMENTKVSDLSPLVDLPRLQKLYSHGCTELTDLSPLIKIPTLENLTIPTTARNIDILKEHQGLRILDFQGQTGNRSFPVTTPAMFWKRWEQQRWRQALDESGIIYTATEIVEETPQVAAPKGSPGGPAKGKPVGKPTGFWSVTVKSKDFSDCSIFKGAPIRELMLGDTAVADLSPLRGIPLKKLGLNGTKVADLSPLQGMPIEDLSLHNTRVADLSVLREMPLTRLILRGSQVSDLSPLAGCRTLKTLVLPANAKIIEFLRDFPLERLGYNLANAGGLSGLPVAEFWTDYDAQGWLRTIPGAAETAKKLSDGTWDVNLRGTEIRDLSILKGQRISRLYLSETAASDLSPLRGMPLKQLTLSRTQVTDLSPLQGMPIEVLLAAETQVTDLSPLRGMPLTRVSFYKCPALTDLSPLADCKELQHLTLPPNAKVIKFLDDPSKFPKLERLSFGFDPKTFLPDKTVADFWKDYDAKKRAENK